MFMSGFPGRGSSPGPSSLDEDGDDFHVKFKSISSRADSATASTVRLFLAGLSEAAMLPAR